MTWRFVAAVAAATAAVTLASGCGTFDQGKARDLVNRVGVERILAAADSVAGLGSSGTRELPRESWPAALGELKPERIDVGQNGVQVIVRGFFVAKEGLFIALRNAEPPKEDLGSDPAFVKLAPRIYWLQYKG